MKNVLYACLAVILYISGCELLGQQARSIPDTYFETSVRANNPDVVMEVFVLEEDGNVHFWKEDKNGVIEKSGRLFSHTHADTDSLHFNEFNIEYCTTGQKIRTTIGYKDAKFLHDLMKEKQRPTIIKVAF